MVEIAWGITGCGDKIEQIASVMVELKKRYDVHVKVYASKSAEMVLRWYRLWDTIKNEFINIRVEVNSNAPFLAGKLQTGSFDLFLIAPTSANTVAKIAHGIADTLLTNAVSQAAKAMIPIYILPCDIKFGETETLLPNGKILKLRIREIDVENVNRLRKMESIEILESVKMIEKIITEHMNNNKSNTTS